MTPYRVFLCEKLTIDKKMGWIFAAHLRVTEKKLT